MFCGGENFLGKFYIMKRVVKNFFNLPRAKFPVRVVTVAWQHGLSGEPKIKTTEPVTREFFIQV